MNPDDMTLVRLMDRLNDAYVAVDLPIVVEDQHGNAYPIEDVCLYESGERYVIVVRADEG